MTHSYGYRAMTRKKFARPFRGHGAIKMHKHLTTYKIGDYVDVLVDGS
jgi:large subunit ribosomal protein L21e